MNRDCRHYIMQSTSRGEKLERCRMDANEQLPVRVPRGLPVLRAPQGFVGRLDRPPSAGQPEPLAQEPDLRLRAGV